MTIVLTVEPAAGGWVSASAGDFVRIIDLDGSQVSDMFAVNAHDLSEWLGAAHTRGATSRLFPAVGQAFYSNRYRPLLTFVADNSPGVHDMLWRACDQSLYGFAGFEGDHASCAGNFRRAAGEIGWAPQEIPDPVDWFQNTPVTGNMTLTSGQSPSRAGDHVVLRAEIDLHLVVTSCAWDLPIALINGQRCSRIRVEVSEQPFALGDRPFPPGDSPFTERMIFEIAIYPDVVWLTTRILRAHSTSNRSAP